MFIWVQSSDVPSVEEGVLYELLPGSQLKLIHGTPGILKKKDCIPNLGILQLLS